MTCVLIRVSTRALPILFLAASALAAAQSPAPNAPLPNPTELLQRALANEKKLAVEQERYECRITDEFTQTDRNGQVKKTTTLVKEQFYVNGVPIERMISKDGRDLSPGEVRKQDEQVMKETMKYSNQAAAEKKTNEQIQQAQDLLAAMMLGNGRRQMENGRGVLYYEIVPNPHFQPKNLNQHFAAVMRGTAAIDEMTGEMIDLDVRSTADLKIAGGLLVNLHKGFWVHAHNRAEPDGVWLMDIAEGNGDARAALFFHPYFRFKETTGPCHLYTATAQQVGTAKPVK